MIFLTRMFEDKIHEGIRLRICILGAQHRRFSCCTTCISKEGKGYRIEDRRLTCTGITGNQIESFIAKLAHIQFL